MNYRLLTCDKFQQDGINQVFMHIEVNTGTEIWGKAARLPASEVAMIFADDANIPIIAQAMADRAVIARPAELVEEAHRREISIEQIKLDTATELAKVEVAKKEAADAIVLAEQAKQATFEAELAVIQVKPVLEEKL